jgi:hypothetical protein
MRLSHWSGVVAGLVLIGGAAGPAAAQFQVVDDDGWCDREWKGDRDRDRYCEVREATLRPTGGSIDVDAGVNGGIAVEGWDRDEIRVLAKVTAWARSETRARELAEAVAVRADGVRISSAGESSGGRESWSVSFRVMVPRRSDLRLDTHNGGIDVTDVIGRISVDATNGGVTLVGTGGDVTGGTRNGGLHVELAGSEWQGERLDVSTMNGGVHLEIPEPYAAHLETGTVNGGLEIDFPITIQRFSGRRITTDIGGGGKLVRVVTTNGGVTVRRR